MNDAKEDKKVSKITSKAFVDQLKKMEFAYEKEHELMDIYYSTEFISTASKFEHLILNNKNVFFSGKTGNGRRTVTKYMSFILGYEYKTFYPTGQYQIRNFKRDLKKLLEYMLTNLNNSVVLMLEDHHFSNMENMDIINTYLASGDFPGVIKTEEIEQILGNEGVEELKKNSASNSTYSCFLEKVKSNLRLVISLDESSSEFVNLVS